MNAQVQKVIRHPAAVPAGVGLLSFGVGVGLGFLLGRKSKKSPPADLHVLPTVDLDLRVDDAPEKKFLDRYIVRSEAEGITVFNNMLALIEDYGSVSVSDLHNLLGIKPKAVEENWGWTSLEYTMVEEVKGGWMLVIPDPEPIDPVSELEIPEEFRDDDEEDDGIVIDEVSEEKLAVGREFIKNRFGLPDLPNDDDLVELEEDDAAEDEEDEEAEASSEEEAPEAPADVEDEGELATSDGSRRANAFAQGGDTWDLVKELRSRKEGVPYVIHQDEFHAEEKGYHQYSLTYYAGDNIMMGEDDQPVYNHNRVVGELKWGHGSGNPLMVYVRNDKHRAEYEITYVDGLFSEEVEGVDISDNQRVKNLEHSEEPRRFRNRTE